MAQTSEASSKSSLYILQDTVLGGTASKQLQCEQHAKPAALGPTHHTPTQPAAHRPTVA